MGEPDGKERPAPDLSVIIPAHDAAATLPAALDAVLAQDWDGRWEVVVVDNASRDATATVIADYATRDARVRRVEAFERRGPSHARVVGVAATSAPWLVFCDADDVVDPGWLANLAGALAHDEVVTGPLDPYRLNPEWLARSRGVYPPDRPLTWHGVFPTASFGNFAIRRATYERIGPFREDYPTGEDHEYSLRLAAAGVALGFAPGAVVAYRMRGTPGDLWRQGVAYGRGRPRLRREVVRAGMRPPGRLSGWRSWALLLLRLPGLRTRAGRAQWCWVAGVRVGHVVGSLHDRTLFI